MIAPERGNPTRDNNLMVVHTRDDDPVQDRADLATLERRIDIRDRVGAKTEQRPSRGLVPATSCSSTTQPVSALTPEREARYPATIGSYSSCRRQPSGRHHVL
ncbi:hypothetical protein GCM10022214_80240 [Actinomadura miaoliensis]|uniref:Uncharacterized protein n=1 Tax=Actinomadura miaoliensis TaxID=430685 RepID=A0ABP7X1N4_9ACTN